MTYENKTEREYESIKLFEFKFKIPIKWKKFRNGLFNNFKFNQKID